MSTYILGQATKERGLLRDAEEPTKHWLEALAAVIPGEALALYTSLIALFTEKGDGTAQATLTKENLVVGLTVVIGLVAIPLAYAVGSGALFGAKHVLRWATAIVAFAVWLWLNPLSAWDAVIDELAANVYSDLADPIVRAAIGIVAAFLVTAAARFAFKKWPLPDGRRGGQGPGTAEPRTSVTD